MRTIYYIVNKVFNCKKTNIYIKIYKSSIKIKYNINEKRKKMYPNNCTCIMSYAIIKYEYPR